MKAWRHWISLIALWMAPAQAHAVSVRLAPEAGACQDETGHPSTTADAMTLAAAMGIPVTDGLLIRPYLEFEMASQAFARSLPTARTLAILDQRGAGLGLGVDLALTDWSFWRTEASFALGENRARTAATYAASQEETSYAVPYRRALAATGFAVTLKKPLSFGVMGGWRETRFEKTREHAEVLGTQAKRTGGLTLTHDRVLLEEHTPLRAPLSLSGWFVRLGLEAEI